MGQIEILRPEHVSSKLMRMAYEIWEKNAAEKKIHILGIRGGGVKLAQLLYKLLSDISDLKLSMGEIGIDKKDISKTAVVQAEELKGENVLIIDDVANSGRTLLYALIPVLTRQPKKIEVAVLVNRRHKSFPIKPDIIGHELSTTLQDNIRVQFNQNEKISVYLE